MNVKKFFFVFLILINFSCKQENKKVLDSDSFENPENTNSPYKGFCTQMSSFSVADAILYANSIDNVDSLKGTNKVFVDIDQFNEWKEQSNKNILGADKTDSINKILNSFNKETLLKTYFGIESAIIHNSIWEYNTLNVKFLDGDANLQGKVMQYAREWEKWCAVRFNIVTNEKADITISFQDKGFWSYIGKESIKFSPSMSLSGIEQEDESYFKGTVLHEFGHALGLVHEHQNPNFSLKWNEPEVIKYYKNTYGWTEEKTYDNVIYRYNFGQYNNEDATAFDPKSIMIYYIPKRLLDENNTVEFKANNELSDLDKELINKKYY
ncbi:M12 family metallopeptidase [Yeosuana marina]|uniref:M12 family metallopeptidase n=1 Tax=Yeosuana marina TaxID=1565536 RepID=UPI0030C8CC27